jgi:hypothetical protein
MGATSKITTQALPVALALVVIVFLISTVRSYLRLRNFEGPRIARLSNFWVFWATLRGELNERTAEILKKHGRPLPILLEFDA